MSHFGSRGRGRGGRGRGGPSRSGLLGSAPGATKPGLLDSLGPRSNQQNSHGSQFQDQHRFEPQKSGLLGNAPNNWQEPTRSYKSPPKHQQYQEPRREPEYSFQEPEPYRERDFEVGQHGKDFQEQTQQKGPSASLPPQIQHIMGNLGLSKADLEELSRLPEKELSPTNLLQVIKNLRDKKAAAARPVPSMHDRAQMQSNQEHGHGRQSFDSRERSPERKALYDPFEPTDDYGNTERYEEQHFPAENRGIDAFSSFKEKWYSDSSKKDERDRGDAQPAGSILRGSRGPVRVSRWERDDRPAPAKQPRRPSPPPLQQRRSPPPIRRPSPQRRHSPPRHISPPPRRMTPPPRRLSSPPRMPPPMQQQPWRGSLLGNPHDPSTQELDLLAATINHSRPQPPQKVFHPPGRSYPEPERFHQPMRQRSPSPPPLLQQPTHPPRPDTFVLQAQMQAMQVLQSEVIKQQAFQPQPMGSRGPPPARGKSENKTSFSKEEAQAEASKMRIEQGRVLYLRYRAGGMGVIREENLLKLAQPFEKVTNILLVAPKNLKTGWYQSFVELADFDGAAAMCEHYMSRSPVVKGITIQVQRSKYKDLKLREHQMNRNFDKLLQKDEVKRRRPTSLSPDRSRTKIQKTSSAERRSFSKEKEKKGSIAKKFGSNNTRSDEKSKKPDEMSKRNDSGKNNKKNTTKIKAEAQGSKEKKPDPAEKSESFKLLDEVGEDKEILGAKELKARELKNGTAKEVRTTGVKRKMDDERLEIIRENIEQASNMSEALLKIIQQKSTQAVISEILEYLSDSLDQLKELKKY